MSNNHNSDSDDDQLVERSTRKAPSSSAALRDVHAIAKPVHRRRAAADPRFDKTLSKTNPNASEHQYAFMRDLATTDASRLRWQAKQARKELQRRKREERVAAGESASSSGDEDSGVEDPSYDERTGMSVQERRDEVIRLGLMRDSVLKMHAQTLREETMKIRSVAGDAAAKAKKARARQAVLQREAKAVASGDKQRAYIPKRSEMRAHEARARFQDAIDNDGAPAPRSDRAAATRAHAAASRLAEKVMKRSARGTRS
jgi:hypothetical protein